MGLDFWGRFILERIGILCWGPCISKGLEAGESLGFQP